FVNAQNYNNINEMELALESASYYRIDGNGYLRLRESSLFGLVRNKDVGYRCLDKMTWYSSIRNKYYSVSMDEAALPLNQVPIDVGAVEEVERYRRTYLEGSRLD